MLTTADMLRREGKAEGKRDALVLLLRQRFGQLPAAAVARVGKARAAELDAWFGRVLTASSLDEVLGRRRGAKFPSRSRGPPYSGGLLF